MDLVEAYLADSQRHDRRLADMVAAHRNPVGAPHADTQHHIHQLQLDTQRLLEQLLGALLVHPHRLVVGQKCQVVSQHNSRANLHLIREELARGSARAQVARDETVRRRHQLSQSNNFWRIKLRHLIEETRVLKAEIHQMEAQVMAASEPAHLLLRLMRHKLSARVSPEGPRQV